MRNLRLSSVFVALATAACGSVVSGEGGAPPERNGFVQSEGCAQSPLDGLPAVACEAGWLVPGLLQLSMTETSYRLDSAVGTGSNKILVGYLAAGEDPDGVVSRVRSFDETLCPLGTMTLVEENGYGDLRPVELAVTENGVGALYGDQLQSGQVAVLEDDASMLSTPLAVPAGYGHALAAGGAGSLTLLSEETLFTVGSAGIEALGPLGISGFQFGRTAFEDGSFLAVWATDEYEGASSPVHVVAQRFAADATPLGAQQAIVERSSYGFISPGPRIVSTRAGDGVAVGFASGHTTHSNMHDQDGTITVPPIVIDGGGSVDAIALAEIDPGELLLAWVSPTDDQASRLQLAIVDSAGGDILGQWDLGAHFIYGSSPRIAQTATGAVVFAGGYDIPAQQQLMMAAPVTRCP
ncbi:MAG: hypothetical protein HOV80_09260 [Polyangiaceae bacterium]|nr:hypothetical protein [Polyangiaceae bacterium]